jgi:hypothetical protein
VATASADLLRNNPETKFNKPEKPSTRLKLIRSRGCPDGWGSLRAGGPMRRVLIVCAVGIVTSALTATASVPSGAKVTLTPAERCGRLSHQVDQAINGTAARQVAEARTLQKRAIRFCARKKTAQGIRTLAKALKLLGVEPTDID